jgi:Holliday junction DNA helicase RuvB
MFCLLIHRLSPIVEEYLYSAMEDFKIDIMIESGPNARMQQHLNPFTLIGATTRSGLLQLLCELVLAFLLNIIPRNYWLQMRWNAISKSCYNGVPQLANARTWFCTNKGNGTIDIEIARYALKALNVDAHGLDEMDNKILNTIIDNLKGSSWPVYASYCCFWKYWNNRRGIWTFLFKKDLLWEHQEVEKSLIKPSW